MQWFGRITMDGMEMRQMAQAMKLVSITVRKAIGPLGWLE